MVETGLHALRNAPARAAKPCTGTILWRLRPAGGTARSGCPPAALAVWARVRRCNFLWRIEFR